ncbi:UNVERIFIED_CONTAM: cystathionine beta-lyase [Siphonaria sp. JEL0065]|nr:cystathionine beta-lyase [Siphonaria sp. JEL0065]
MSALDAILRLVKAGDEIIAGDDLYGEKPKFVLLESPTNPMIKIADVPTISSLVHAACPDVLVIVDNTMMSPILMNCLELGADIEYHSGTKYLSGHHDLMAGVFGVKDKKVADRIYFVINSIGCGLAPFDSFLLLRGLKTLSLRLERQQDIAAKVSQFLEDAGFKVSYPGLNFHPQKKLHMSMAKGARAALSSVTGDVEKSTRIVEVCQLWGIIVSFGCVNSLISMPCNMSHASIPAAVRKARSLPDDLIRLCVGIEDVDDFAGRLEGCY